VVQGLGAPAGSDVGRQADLAAIKKLKQKDKAAIEKPNFRGGLFSKIFGYKDLKNLNTPQQPNFPGIDLRDETARLAFQITASTNNRKIKETLRHLFIGGKHGTGIVACMRK
jgi:SMEK domain